MPWTSESTFTRASSRLRSEMFLTMNANAVGIEFGCDYAVSFEVYEI